MFFPLNNREFDSLHFVKWQAQEELYIVLLFVPSGFYFFRIRKQRGGGVNFFSF